MFLGHYAVALGAKRLAPAVSLGTLVAASQLVDLVWPVLLLVGVEHVRIDPGNTAFTPLDFYDYPISHSLIGALGWSAAFALVYYLFRRSARNALLLGGVAFSHWVLDLLTHRPDLPLAPGSPQMFGLGLWNSVWGTLVVESGLFLAGLFLYTRATTPADRIGAFGLWGFVLVLILIYAANVLAPPPPDAGAIAYAGNASWLFVLWAAWLDRHRRPREVPRA